METNGNVFASEITRKCTHQMLKSLTFRNEKQLTEKHKQTKNPDKKGERTFNAAASSKHRLKHVLIKPHTFKFAKKDPESVRLEDVAQPMATKSVVSVSIFGQN